jgi:amidohydrolase
MLREELMKMLDGREDDMIALRRHFHEHPELSFDEKETAAFIARFYENKSVDVQTNVGNGYGIIVTIKGNKPGRTIALRADFDALQIEEQTGLPFASKNHGVMHACGHDGHTAYLMILADCLIRLRDQWEGTVKIVHQHAEEMAPAGAKSIMDSGLLDDVDEIYGIHFYPDYEVGTVFYTSGFAYAGCSDIKVTIQGTGGHGSQPHRSNDTIVAASSFVMNLQTIVSRRINPYDMAVVTIGSFEAVGSSNVIKDSLILRGDARYMDLEVGKVIEEHFHRIGRGLEEMYRREGRNRLQLRLPAFIQPSKRDCQSSSCSGTKRCRFLFEPSHRNFCQHWSGGFRTVSVENPRRFPECRCPSEPGRSVQ